jgi:hypothetical protein
MGGWHDGGQIFTVDNRTKQVHANKPASYWALSTENCMTTAALVISSGISFDIHHRELNT